MYCPACKAEYRPGFTHCPDCDVDLVDSLTADGSDGQDVPTDADGKLLLWSGLDPELYGAICDALDAANIAHTDTDRQFGLPTLGQKVLLVWVNPHDWTVAGPIIDRVLKERDSVERDSAERGDIRMQADAARMNPFGLGRQIYPGDSGERADPFAAVSAESSLSPDDSPGSAPDDIAAGFNPEDATEGVWTGKDSEMAEMVRVCLRENGIGCVVEERRGERAVLVTPESEGHAKEIVGQIVRGTPS
jgi:hypothetical protein